MDEYVCIFKILPSSNFQISTTLQKTRPPSPISIDTYYITTIITKQIYNQRLVNRELKYALDLMNSGGGSCCG